MFKFEMNQFIERPQQEVFDFIANPENDPKWRDSAISSEMASEGPVGVGSTIRSEDKFLGRKMESTSEITVWEPPNAYGQKALNSPLPYEFTVNLKPEGNGTRIIMEGQAELGGFFKIAEGLAGKQMEKQMEADFKNLKKVMEGNSASTA
jgi:carbon monoxide dehydrogenase subunit G